MKDLKTESSEPATVANLHRPGGSRNQSRSATRALDILEYFAMVGRPLRAVEIAQAFDLRTSSTDQLLKTMVDSAYLQFDSTNKLYYPSPRLVNFGAWLSSNYFGEDRLSRLLHSVQKDCREIVTLSIRRGESMQIFDLIEPQSQAGTIPKGLRVSVTESIIGAAFLAAHTDREVIRIVEQIALQTKQKRTPAELQALVKRIQSIRQAGYAAGPAVSVPDPWALAVALPRPAAATTIVLGIAGKKTAIQSREQVLIEIINQHIGSCLPTVPK